MSFILDALKKSEAERQRKDGPGIASIPEGTQQKSSPKWIWLVLGLLAINLVVLAGLMYKVEQDSNTDEPSVTAASPDKREIPAVATSEIVSDNRQNQAAVKTVEPEATGVRPAVDVISPATTTASEQTGAVNSGLETFNDLRAKGILVLPDMHLDIHVYGGEVSDRFVFVNMSKYKENATLREGPVVSEITPDGVILNYQGTSFLLPRE